MFYWLLDRSFLLSLFWSVIFFYFMFVEYLDTFLLEWVLFLFTFNFIEIMKKRIIRLSLEIFWLLYETTVSTSLCPEIIQRLLTHLTTFGFLPGVIISEFWRLFIWELGRWSEDPYIGCLRKSVRPFIHMYYILLTFDEFVDRYVVSQFFRPHR